MCIFMLSNIVGIIWVVGLKVSVKIGMHTLEKPCNTSILCVFYAVQPRWSYMGARVEGSGQNRNAHS